METKIERYYGQIIKVGGNDVKSTVIAGLWMLNYVEVPYGEELKYSAAIHKEGGKIVKVLPGLVVFD